MFPQSDKRIIVTNGKKSYQGTVSYTKNIDLTEDGYLKLSPPMCRVIDSATDSNFGLPYIMLIRTDGVYKTYTAQDIAYDFTLETVARTASSALPGSGGSNTTRAVLWVSNNWFINLASAVYEYDASGVSSTYTSRIATALDFIEVFVNRNTLVGALTSSPNVVKQYNTSFSNTTDLTLPANYAVTGLAYSNHKIGVATKQRKNQGKALFAIWDGATTESNTGFLVDDPYILDVASYKSSWVILTSSGLLLFFNGGGFTELGRLPMYDLQQRIANFSPTNSLIFGKIINVDGDKIYLNAPSLPETAKSRKPYEPFYSGGAYCYDPNHGLYHTAAPSYSRYQQSTITFASNVGTTSVDHFLETGDELFVQTTLNELTAKKIYYAIKLTSTTFSIAETYDDAIVGTVKSITNDDYSLFYIRRYDYGIEIQKMIDCGLVLNGKDWDGYTESGVAPFFIGTRIHPNNLSGTKVTALNVAVPIMHNRGYFVLGKFQTTNLQDTYQAVAVKYAKLKAQDKIVVKGKTVDQDPIIVGDETLFDATYSGESVTWDANGMYFETSADLSNAEVGDEVHVFAGPGAGQSAHITEITTVGTTYQVTLDEKIRGVTSNAKSCVSIDKFKKLGTITSEDTLGVKRLPLGNHGTSLEVKVELRGIGTKVSEILPIRTTHQGI